MIYAVGDIHGQSAMLDSALARIDADGGPNAKIVFLGDYTDRGPDSSGVIQRLCDGLDAGRDWVCIKGNHDRMFEWFMQDEPRHDPHMLVGYHWLHERLGGTDTLASYGITYPDRTRLRDVHDMALETVPRRHVDFLHSLVLTYETDAVFFAHAGIRPGVPLADQDEEDLLWIRQEFHAATDPHPKLIVHGHTPIDVATHYGNRVNLDTGAGYGKPLSVAVFDGADAYLLGENGRELLQPQVG